MKNLSERQMIAQCHTNRHPFPKQVQESSVMGAKHVVGIYKETQECLISSTFFTFNVGGP